MGAMGADGGVLVVGSANMDLVVRTPRIPRPGETLIGHTFATFPGGKGANQAVAAGRLGGKVAFLGKVGEDDFGTALLASLAGAGVDASLTLRDAGCSSGVALIEVEDSGQNSIAIVPGANGRLTGAEVTSAAEKTDFACLLVQLEVPDEAVFAALEAGKHKGQAILNPAPARKLPAGTLDGVALVTPNESEAETLTGIFPKDPETCRKAARALMDQGAKAVILTLGSNGCFYADAAGDRLFPAIRVTPVDTTAAGDAFNGALAHFLAAGREMPNAIQLATCVAGLSTTKAGAQTSMPTLEELRAVAGALL